MAKPKPKAGQTSEKSLVEKIVETVDQVIHPTTPAAQPEAAKTGEADPSAADTKTNEEPAAPSQMHLHKKFDKFKAGGAQ